MIPEAGIGILYLPGLENLIESFSEKLDVVELEPQTIWYKKNLEEGSFRFDVPSANWLKSINKPITFHGVGFPIGGTIKADANHFHTLTKHIDFLDPLYISEHLSFNKFKNSDGDICQVNFLLPVVQNQNGIAAAVENISEYKKNIQIPFAFETGVNYLGPREGELPDGFFFREVAEKSDSYILLDIHNILANELNGRQRVSELINMLPLERVIEIHLGGGEYYNDYYIDAHSRVSSKELLHITDEIVKCLPNLKVMIFEMIPEYYTRTVTDVMVNKQLDDMKRIWDHRGKKYKSKPKAPSLSFACDESISSTSWEESVGSLVNSTPIAANKITSTVAGDKGLQIIRDLIYQFRASAIVSALKLTCRYIKLMTDNETLYRLLKEYCLTNPSEIFGFANAERFARFIKTKKLAIEFVDEITDFEIAAMHSTIDGKKRVISLSFEPFAFLNALVRHEKPRLSNDKGVVYETELTNDGFFNSDELMKLGSVFHN